MNTLKIISALVRSLDESAVRYCCWKGSVDIGKMLAGDDDLDLLVDRADSAAMQAIILGQGFKLSRSGREKACEGLLDYFGCDIDTGKIVHLQLYHQIIVGQRLTENIRLPLENAFLSTRRKHASGLYLPSPESELIVFALRKCVQHGIKYLLRPGSLRKVTRDVAIEIESLSEKSDAEKLAPVLLKYLPTVTPGNISEIVRLMTAKGSVYGWISHRRLIMRRLRVFHRRHFIVEKYEWIRRRLILYRGAMVEGRAPRRTLSSGGLSIAVIGSDGSGKSTAVTYLSGWLGKSFEVRRYHLGRPPPSLVTRLLSIAVRFFARLSGGKMRMPKPGQETPMQWPAVLVWIPLMLAVLTARDRYRTYSCIQRDVAKGKLVIVDRFPMKQIDWMDGAIVPRIIADKRGLFYRIEQSYYEKIQPADYTLVLVVAPETAAQRQIGDGYEYVVNRARKVHQALGELSQGAEVIDTSCGLTEVESKLRAAIWRII